MRPRVLVTGCAGFIGSHLCERLISEGSDVIGIDALTPYYDPLQKRSNLAGLLSGPHFHFVEQDLAAAPLHELAAGVDLVVHLAAQPGVRGSFGEGFAAHANHNLMATQRVFDAARAAGARRVVWASSSSVYGDADLYPVDEDAPRRPRSPYGVTKKACEDIARIHREGGLDVVGLRLFTVYGPRQRPDMAFRRLTECAVSGEPFPLFGSGTQSRDFTYVDDVVDAFIRAGAAISTAPVYNIGGGEETSLCAAIDLIEGLAGDPISVDRLGGHPGDVSRTCADTRRATRDLGWRPRTRLADGLERQLEWVHRRREVSRPGVLVG